MLSDNQFAAHNMYDIIAASFFQKKSCILPGIGQLSFVSTPAETDFSNGRINAPKQSIVFIPAGDENRQSFNEFSALSELMKRKLDEDGQVIITGIGSFTKLANGQLYFKAVELDPVFLQPVEAIRVIRQDAEHAILVGDKETTNTAMNEILHVEEEEAEKDRWWIWAAIFAITAITILSWYMSQYGFKNFGNLSHF